MRSGGKVSAVNLEGRNAHGGPPCFRRTNLFFCTVSVRLRPSGDCAGCCVSGFQVEAACGRVWGLAGGGSHAGHHGLMQMLMPGGGVGVVLEGGADKGGVGRRLLRGVDSCFALFGGRGGA